jgi:small subunit ribosomal protein S16
VAVKIRLARAGAKKKPFYKIVAADSRMKRDGRFLEKLGTWDPINKSLNFSKEGVEKWIATGASPTESVAKLLNKEGFDFKFSYVPKAKQEKKADESE